MKNKKRFSARKHRDGYWEMLDSRYPNWSDKPFKTERDVNEACAEMNRSFALCARHKRQRQSHLKAARALLASMERDNRDIVDWSAIAALRYLVNSFPRLYRNQGY